MNTSELPHGISRQRLDALLIEDVILCAFTARDYQRDISQFLEILWAPVGTESVKEGKKKYFVRIGSFRTSSPFTAIDQFASG
jgi:hypothetical protein